MPDTPDAVCRDVRAWLSAHRDSEAPDDPSHRSHIDGCAPCGAWMAGADRMTQRLRLHTVGSSPDVVSRAVHAMRGRQRPSPLGRGLLAAAGVMAVAIAAIGFASGQYTMALDSHVFVELHAFEAALGIAFLAAARSPRRYVHVLLAVTGTVAVGSAIATTSALASGSIDLFMELSHVPPLIGLAGLVLLVSDPRPRSVLHSASA